MDNVVTWEMIAKMNMGGDELLTEMQDFIQEALNEGADPGPAVALALVKEATARQNLHASLTNAAAYVLNLETRLIKAGFRFGKAEARIFGD